MAKIADANKENSTVRIRRYSASLSRVDLKYKNYESKTIDVVKETSTTETSYEAFYQSAVALLARMYEESKEI